MNFKMKRLFMLILISIYTQMLFSSTNENDLQQKVRGNIAAFHSRLLDDSIDKITTENETIQNYDRKQLTELGKNLIGSEIYSFFNAKERASLRLLSQFFYTSFDDLHLNPHKILYPSLNIIERQLNDKLIDNARKWFWFKNEDDTHNHDASSNMHFIEGYKLKTNKWQVSNLDLSTYGSQNFKLDMSVGIGSVEIRESYLLNEQVTNPQVGDWIAITNSLTLAQIMNGIDMHITEDKLVVTGFEFGTFPFYFYVKEVETDKNGLKQMIIGEINRPEDTEEPKIGDYWISSDMFKSLTKVKPITKNLEIVKDSDGITVNVFDLVRRSSNSCRIISHDPVTKTDLKSVIAKFCPEENKVIILIENEEFASLENPNYLELTMNPHEYNFYLKFL